MSLGVAGGTIGGPAITTPRRCWMLAPATSTSATCARPRTSRSTSPISHPPPRRPGGAQLMMQSARQGPRGEKRIECRDWHWDCCARWGGSAVFVWQSRLIWLPRAQHVPPGGILRPTAVLGWYNESSACSRTCRRPGCTPRTKISTRGNHASWTLCLTFEQIVKDHNNVAAVSTDPSVEDAVMGRLDENNWELSKLYQENDGQLRELADELGRVQADSG
jgi:hypothetical protein